jgi:hypothetical protein
MKIMSAATLACAILAASNVPSFADAMHGSMMSSMPTCKAGDPVVGVNTQTKTYMSQDQMKAKTAGMTATQKHTMMMQNHIAMMCKSKADAMGAKMTPMKPHM